MKPKHFLVPVILIFVAILTVFVVFGNQDVVAGTFSQMSPPTPAPTRTPGPPPRITPISIPTLTQPLNTEEQVLKRALEIDAGAVAWSQPWSLDTPRLEPGRISIKGYPDRSFEGNQYSSPWLESGPVWVVTIKGNVRLNLPGGLGPVINTTYDGVTYIIAQKTGSFLGWRSGMPIIQPTTKAPLPQPPSVGTPDALASLTTAACTQNPSGLSVRVSQQPGKSSIPGAAGPIYSFLVEGTGFAPGEKVSIVIKGRVTVPGSMGTTTETVLADSTFATSIGAAVTQPNMPFDFFIVHGRGVACVSVITVQ